jgi:hypothetical protein
MNEDARSSRKRHVLNARRYMWSHFNNDRSLRFELCRTLKFGSHTLSCRSPAIAFTFAAIRLYHDKNAKREIIDKGNLPCAWKCANIVPSRKPTIDWWALSMDACELIRPLDSEIESIQIQIIGQK